MVVDTSALIAILAQEPGYEALVDTIMSAEQKLLSTASLLEASLVASSKGADGNARLDGIVAELGLVVMDVTLTQVEFARAGFRRFGKGRHPAALNFGDCFVYALAKERGLPVLCKGNDFARTDLPVVPAQPATPAPGSPP